MARPYSVWDNTWKRGQPDALSALDLVRMLEAGTLPTGGIVAQPAAAPSGATPADALSNRVWQAGQDTRAQIDRRIRLAVASKQTPEALARELEQYLVAGYVPKRDNRRRLLPTADQPPGAITVQGRGRGSWPARRLARTELAAAHRDAILATVERDPLARGIQWRLSPRHADVDECDDNATRSSTGFPRGTYTPDELPRYPNHPADLCRLRTYRRKLSAAQERELARSLDDVEQAAPFVRRLSQVVTLPDLAAYRETISQVANLPVDSVRLLSRLIDQRAAAIQSLAARQAAVEDAAA